MIEAVENHTPQAIIIDEIGTELEALAASTIAQRGVQLVGTAHGVTIENIMKNPSLQILVGGIEVIAVSLYFSLRFFHLSLTIFPLCIFIFTEFIVLQFIFVIVLFFLEIYSFM